MTFCLLSNGCAPKHTRTDAAPERGDPCGLTVESADRLDTVTVALLEPVSMKNATSPTNDSERLLYRNLFDNLIRLDCQGNARPGLAESWRPETGGWVLTLREDAGLTPRSLPLIDTATAAALGIDSAVALDDRRIRIALRTPVRDSVPRFLADPALALIHGIASDSGSGERSLVIPRRGNLPVLDFRSGFEPDGRDALDHGADLVVTRDPALLDYVARQPEFAAFPLPWSRTYVLWQPPGIQLIGADLQNEAVRASLASEAVLASARAAQPDFWWSDSTGCSTNPAAPRARLAPPVIVYSADDDVARGLAERLVALARRSPQLRTVGLPPTQFAAAVRAGADWGYVIALPRQTLMPCRGWADLPSGGTIQPLIDTRAHAVVRRGSPPLTVDWDGTVRVDRP